MQSLLLSLDFSFCARAYLFRDIANIRTVLRHSS